MSLEYEIRVIVKVAVAEAISGWAAEDFGNAQRATMLEFAKTARPWTEEESARVDAVRKLVPKTAVGCRCSICGNWQRWTPSGMTCKNGHGGAPSINVPLYDL